MVGRACALAVLAGCLVAVSAVPVSPSFYGRFFRLFWLLHASLLTSFIPAPPFPSTGSVEIPASLKHLTALIELWDNFGSGCLNLD